MQSEMFDYRHKKFDHGKRSPTGSSSCSSRDTDSPYIKQEIEKKDKDVDLQSCAEHSPVLNLSRKESSIKRTISAIKTEEGFVELPEAKRLCLDAFVGAIKHRSTTPLATAAITLPPTVAAIPKISNETLRSICKYHGNMVRKFPKKERTPKDQERRNKNTIACRMSRRVKKLEQIAIEEQYKEFSQQAFNMIEQTVRAAAYLNELTKLSNKPSPTGVPEIFNSEIKTEKSSSPGQQKKPFSIAFLTGTE